ncbi:MAG: MBOAT family protein [Firmicutes bacterium]|nr:MBOAT family protein [Bacillota bacterium]
MVFSSLEFLYLFFPLCMLFYCIAKTTNLRNAVLIVFSLFFYAWGEPVYLFLMLGTVLAEYFFALGIEKFRRTVLGKLCLAGSLVVALGLLAIFKYAGFLVGSVNSLFGLSIPVPQIDLPIGISFYTFQIVSYLVDVYRGDVRAQRQPLKLLLYISLFHQLIAGPIVRYEHIADEIDNRRVTPVEVSMGIDRFIVGLAKKVILADTCAQLAKTYLESSNLAEVPVLGAWFGLIMYSMQIYFDFSGYSDMAIGMGRMVGFHYHENFNYPYLSGSITEFWRRWHMSLGSFFRDYVYIPLGGNRCSSARHIFNLFIVWFLTGLWHGASWNFVMWGLYFFVFLVLEKYFIGKFLSKHKIFSHIYFLFLIVIGWMIFYYTDISRMGTLFKGLFGLNGNAFTSATVMTYFKNNVFFVLAAVIACTPVLKVIKKLYVRVCQSGVKANADGTLVSERNIPAAAAYVVKGIVLALLLFTSTAMLVGNTYHPFIYFRF